MASVTSKYLLLILVVVTTLFPVMASAADEVDALILPEEQEVQTPARSPRPVSRVAENVSVITAEQIALLNAHTLADVLQTIAGFQLQQVQSPGGYSPAFLQGAVESHVLVLIDGVPQNTLIEGFADYGLIPVQQVERVEIIKGAASAAWGQALGGVINVITKGPDTEQRFGGAIFASGGERATSDARAEVSGGVDRLGYYLSGGNLHSNGHLPNTGVNHNSIYGKFTWDLPNDGIATLGLSYQRAHRGLDQFNTVDASNNPITLHDTYDPAHAYSFLTIRQPLTQGLILEFSGRGSRKDNNLIWGHLYQGVAVADYNSLLRERTWGGSGKILWGGSGRSLAAGVDYEHAVSQNRDLLDPSSFFFVDRTFNRWGVYGNGALDLGRLTILPGFRYDHTGIGSSVVSYTLGATYRLTDKTTLRGYAGRGYSLPSIYFGNGPQQVWTVQIGGESDEVPYLWLKGTLFYNDLWNVETVDNAYVSVMKEQIKQGVELEARTVPVFGFSFHGGYTWTDARDRESRVRLQSVPIHSIKLAGSYRNENWGLSGIATGNYVWWNTPAEYNGTYKPMVWDLSLTQKLVPHQETSPELFFTGHNLFNGSQYAVDLYKNTGRWLEGGVRFRF